MTQLTKVKGIGPATGVKLHSAGISTAEHLARFDEDQLVGIVGRATAAKIIKNAQSLMKELGIDYKTLNIEEVSKTDGEESEEIVDAQETTEDQYDLSSLPGIGPKTQKDLKKAGFTTVPDVATATIGQLQEVQGVGSATAEKIKKAAMEILGIKTETIDQSTKKTKKKPKPKKVQTITTVEEDGQRSVHEKSPIPHGIPTRKKRGVQIASSTQADKIDLDSLERTKAPAQWQVKTRTLSKEELAERKKRQEQMALASKITREIPEPPRPVTAKKEEKRVKTEKPVKQKQRKVVVKKASKSKTPKREEIDYFTNEDIYQEIQTIRVKGKSKASEERKPRIEMDRNTYIGRISSKRRSRRNVNNRQAILDLENGFEPDQLLGKKIFFTYPEGTKLSGSVAKRFGKRSSLKVIVQFKKGLREDAMHQKVFTY